MANSDTPVRALLAGTYAGPVTILMGQDLPTQPLVQSLDLSPTIGSESGFSISSVREAVLDTVAELVSAGGISAVSMTKVAKDAGISRVTLYKYFPDVEALLAAWHERQVEQHLGHLHHVRAHLGSGHGQSPVDAVRAVLEAYALILQKTPMNESPGFLHSSSHVGHAQEHLHDFLSTMIDDAKLPASGNPAPSPGIRSDMGSSDLASFASHAVNAAAAAPTPEAARALVGVIVDGMIRYQ